MRTPNLSLSKLVRQFGTEGTRMKQEDTQKYLVITVVAMLAVGAGMFFILGGGKASTTDTITVDGQTVAPWANKIVNYKLIVADKFTGTNVAGASAKVYDAQPEEWLNARGDFDKTALYTAYTVAGDTILINKELPGTYYVVLTAAGHNTDFLTVTIPDGKGRGDISEYQSNPDSKAAEMTALGTTLGENIDLGTLTNGTAQELKDNALETVAANTEFRGWKVIVNDVLGFSTDGDGDGKYDEGVARYTVSVGSKSVKVFDPAAGVDLFDSNDEYSFLMSDVVADKGDLVIKVEVRADTTDGAPAANDEKLQTGEVLGNIRVFDAAGTVFATVLVTG
jgi:hypothetical protein